MLPDLRDGDFDAALAAALGKVDAAATADHAANLERGRQLNAVVGLVGAPIVFMGLVGWAAYHWRRFGKDPVYLDDPSILMPAPPPDLTAASGAMIVDGATSRRALTTAMLDLASRGLIAFRDEPGILWQGHKVGIDTAPASGDDVTEAHRRLNSRRPMGPAEKVARDRLASIASDGFISSEDLPKFGSEVAAFDSALEEHVVGRGWFGERPSKVVSRWVGRGALAVVAGIIAVVAGLNIPMSGLTLIGAAAIAGGIVVVILSRAMPAVTMAGSMVRAMLAAYRRTLEKTMAQARSMDQVVEEAGLDWLDTPDQAVVWGTALGLQSEIEGVLGRSLEDVREGRSMAATPPYFPAWYQTSSGTPFLSSAGSRQRRQHLLRLGHPGRRRDDVGAGHDRELAVVLWRRRWWRWRLRWRLIGRRRGWCRRRLLAPEAEAGRRPGDGQAGPRGHGRPTVHSANGCSRDDGRLLREAEHG